MHTKNAIHGECAYVWVHPLNVWVCILFHHTNTNFQRWRCEWEFVRFSTSISPNYFCCNYPRFGAQTILSAISLESAKWPGVGMFTHGILFVMGGPRVWCRSGSGLGTVWYWINDWWFWLANFGCGFSTNLLRGSFILHCSSLLLSSSSMLKSEVKSIWVFKSKMATSWRKRMSREFADRDKL